jgi:hypothetical protein
MCVRNEGAIGGGTYAGFQRGGAPRSDHDWGANVDNICFYQNRIKNATTDLPL